MSDKVAFFYLNGTDPLIATAATLIGDVLKQPRLGLLTLPGLNGRTVSFMDGNANNDPFPSLLDPTIFEARKIWYPALFLPIQISMEVGIANVVAAIQALPAGQKFMLGGYSQGAAAMSTIYTRLRSGDLSSYNSRFLGGVMFGNPRRQVNYRGEVGGTYSGSWNTPGSTTGGHGAFPATGTYPRLTSCESNRWIEFTEVNDVFSGTGDTTREQNWTQAISALINYDLAAAITAIANFGDVNAALSVGNAINTFTDAVGRVFDMAGAGHVRYPWEPPPGDPDNGLSSYQIAIKWLTSKALETATAPILLPSEPVTTASAGWSTTLVPPAA